MTMFFELAIYGGTIGYKLADDAEETAAALKELARSAGKKFCDEVADHTSWDAKDIVPFLRKLADAIEAGAKS